MYNLKFFIFGQNQGNHSGWSALARHAEIWLGLLTEGGVGSFDAESKTITSRKKLIIKKEVWPI